MNVRKWMSLVLLGFGVNAAIVEPASAESFASNDFSFDLHTPTGNSPNVVYSVAPFAFEGVLGGARSASDGTKDADDEMTWDLAGPYEMRSADPEEYCALEVKNIFGWETTKGQEDEFEYEFEIEWGFAEDHEAILEIPVEIGDGGVDGNADLELGWHWRLWREGEWTPAFAMRTFVRLPTGYHSSGVDAEWIGLFTKSIIPGKVRFNANPFVKTVNGNNEEDARDFLWGGSFGLDWRVNDELILVGLYRYETGEVEGTRDNHSLQFGGEWDIDEHSEIGFSTTIGLDGDESGPAFGVLLSYIYEF